PARAALPPRRARVGWAERQARVVCGDAPRAGGVLLASVGLERDRLRRPGLPARLHADGRRRPPRARAARGRGGVRAGPGHRRQGAGPRVKGSLPPRDNRSAFLLDVHRRGIPGAATMRRHRDVDEVDLAIVGAGAGGSVLAQRLARRGWRIVVLESGPLWDPDRDWVSDEAGQHKLYWTEERIIGGE